MTWSDSVVIAAFVTAIGSMILAAINFFLSQMKSERSARREYEYTARKRLYSEFEPLSFQLVELSEIALRRIKGLAREAKQGFLESDSNSYHMINAIYRLLAPLAVFRIMQQRLTLADVALVKSVKVRYDLAKILYYSFTHDVRLASSDPQITSYDPKNSPKQGIYYQSFVDTMADTLIIKEPGDRLRVMTFDEFQITYNKDPLHKPFDKLSLLLSDFHPKSKPVLWRILILQAYVYKDIKRIHHLSFDFSDGVHRRHRPSVTKFSREEREDFTWHTVKSDEDEALNQPFTAVENYLSNSWESLLEK